MVARRAEVAAQEALRQGRRREESVCAIDLGSGSGLLALMLAQAIDKGSGGKAAGGEGASGRLTSQPLVQGVEVVAGVAELGRKVIDHNGRSASCSLIRAEGHALCAQVAKCPSSERPKVPMLVAELMDSGGLGEGQSNYPLRCPCTEADLTTSRRIPHICRACLLPRRIASARLRGSHVWTRCCRRSLPPVPPACVGLSRRTSSFRLRSGWRRTGALVSSRSLIAALATLPRNEGVYLHRSVM